MSGVAGRSGRRPKPIGLKQEHKVNVRFTGDEIGLVFKACHDRGMKLSTFLREIVLKELRGGASA